MALTSHAFYPPLGEPADDLGRRRQVLEVSPGFLLSLVARPAGPIAYEVKEGLPEDAFVVGFRYDAERNLLELTVVSREFEPVPDGVHAPPCRRPALVRYNGVAYDERLAEWEAQRG